ncbi:MAG: bifunctional diguanylate cyclase/phosphodiesterase [Pseudomonadota bacterium]
MSDKLIKTKKNTGVYSLRQRYLFASTIIIILIFAFAWLAQSYVSNSSEQHQNNIEDRLQANRYVRQLRNEVLHIEKRLEAFMWTPSAQRRNEVHHTIDRSLHYFELLRQHQWIIKNEIEHELGDFSQDLKALHITLDRVMDMRQEKPSENPGLNAVDLNTSRASQHFTAAGNELRLSSHTLAPQLDTTLQLWKQMQQQLKAYHSNTVNKLSSKENLALQQQIESSYTQIDKLLEQVAIHPLIATNHTHQQLLGDMIESLKLWLLGYEGIKIKQNSNGWRDNIPFLKHTVEPHFDHLWEYLAKLETNIEKFSQTDAMALGNVANTVAKVLWLVCFFGLAVITVAYLYFQGTVLKSISTVAHRLKSDAAGEQFEALPQVHNLETLHLIDAYKDMRHQVQDRQQALEHIAMHDSLTTLPNRYHLMSKLQALCDTSQQEQSVFAVIMLGLDRFKEINDTLGQYTGDIILKKYGQRLQLLLHESDSVARFAGDEFALLIPGANIEEALHIARKIHNEMELPIDIEGISLSVSCSIGFALYPYNGQNNEELTRRANIAMAIAKKHKIGITQYDERYDTSSVERISLAGKLRQAVQADELHLCYQPQFFVHNCELSGIEVLCRWDEPERGPITPEEFIPVAEQTGQIHALTEWVISTALQQAQEWRAKGLDCGFLAINISAFNLHAPNFYSLLETQLEKWNYPASKLMLEITETAMMADPEHAIKILGKLRQLGLKLSIDDYGTGFSSLSYIKQLPVNELKIDKSFIMDMTENENDAIIVRSTIELAHNLGLKVVAEGVDTKEKQDLLEILNCDYMQGFHIGKPISAQQIEYLIPPLKEKSSKVSHLRDFR